MRCLRIREREAGDAARRERGLTDIRIAATAPGYAIRFWSAAGVRLFACCCGTCPSPGAIELSRAAPSANFPGDVEGRGVFENRFNGALNRLWRRHEHSKPGGARLLDVHGV